MTWILFPLYGLKIAEPDAWLDQPLFGDATLISRDALRNHLGPEAPRLLSHGKLSDDLGHEAFNDPAFPPADQLVEIAPPSYVAVRDKSDDSKTERRASEIRTLLSATLALRAKTIQAVAASPAQVAWFIAPVRVMLDPSKPTQTSIAPVLNEHVLVKPLEVSRQDLRMSLEHGLVIPNAHQWPWDISRTHPVCQLFLSKPTKFQRRLLDGAVQVQQASCATTYEAQLQLAVAALELLLKPKSFADLAKILKAFFQGPDQAERIESVLGTRHRVTHEGAGRGDPDGKIKAAAQHAIAFGWLMLDILAAFDRGVTTASFDEYIDMLSVAISLDEKAARFGSTSERVHEKALHDTFSSFMQFLTVRVDWQP